MAGENTSEKVSVNINTSTLAQIDLLVDNGYFSNRSDFINQAVREGLHKHRNTLDRIIDGGHEQCKGRASQWFVGVVGFDRRMLNEMASSGEMGSITGYGVLMIAEELADDEVFAVVKSIKVKGKVIARKSIKEHYGIK